jgi:hypothetical protein
LFAIALGLVCAAPRAVHADCASGATYRIDVSGSSVTICPSATTRTCGSSIDLLRQNEADSSLVVVGNSCSPTSSGCYLDLCVPPGTYRYGYATAYDCSEAGCGSVALFSETTVTAALASGCTPATPAPTPTSEATPWMTGAYGSVARFKSCGGGGGCATAGSTDRARVRWLNATAVAAGIAIVLGRVRARRRRAATRPRP